MSRVELSRTSSHWPSWDRRPSSCTLTYAQQPSPQMSFFITSAGSGRGANLGGLQGADAHCAMLAKQAGAAGNRTWRAYLSTQRAAGGQRPRPHRHGPLVQRQGRDDREERRRSAFRQEQPDEGDPAHREGHGRQRPRRHAEQARHPDRSGLDGRAVGGRRRYDLQQLDERRRPAAPWSATTIVRAAAPTRRRGTPRTRPRAAARRTWSAPAATASSTASRPTDGAWPSAGAHRPAPPSSA